MIWAHCMPSFIFRYQTWLRVMTTHGNIVDSLGIISISLRVTHEPNELRCSFTPQSPVGITNYYNHYFFSSEFKLSTQPSQMGLSPKNSTKCHPVNLFAPGDSTSRSDDVNMCQWSVSSLFQAMSWPLFGTKSSPETMLTYCQFDP